MMIVASNSITVSNVNDGTITHLAYSWSADGTDRFMTVYPGGNLLTGTGSHTVTGTATNDYLSNETNNDFLTIFKGLEGKTVTISVDYEYSGFVAGSSRNRLGWETRVVTDSAVNFGLWYYPNNGSGSGRMSLTFVVPKNITKIRYANGYIQFSGTETGTLSHLKLEKGSVATPWTPSPLDDPVNAYPHYVGHYTDYEPVDSADPKKYTWEPYNNGIYNAYSWSSDGRDRFTTVYPGENLLSGGVSFIASNTTYTVYQLKSAGALNLDIDRLNKERTLTVSAYISVKNSQRIQPTGFFRIGYEGFFELSNGKTGYIGVWKNGVSGETFSGRVITTYTLPEGVDATKVLSNGNLYHQQNGEYLEVSHLKIEYGNNLDPIYTPAPSEDPVNAYPTYSGTSLKNSDNAIDYNWSQIIPKTYTGYLMDDGSFAKELPRNNMANGSEKFEGVWHYDAIKSPKIENSYLNYPAIALTSYQTGAYLHTAWSSAEDGSKDFSTTKKALSYVGFYCDYTAADSTDYKKYLWKSTADEDDASATGLEFTLDVADLTYDGFVIGDFEPETWYAVSFFAKSSLANGKVRTNVFPDAPSILHGSQGQTSTAADGLLEWVLSTEYVRYWYKFKTKAAASMATRKQMLWRMDKSFGKTTSYIALPKIEKIDEESANATNWVPSLSDDFLRIYPKQMGTQEAYGLNEPQSEDPDRYTWNTYGPYLEVLYNRVLSGKLEIEDFEDMMENSPNLKDLVAQLEAQKSSYDDFITNQYQDDINAAMQREVAIKNDLDDKIAQYNFINTVMSMGEEGLSIHAKDSPLKMLLNEEGLSFIEGQTVVAYFTNQAFHINQGAVVQSLQVGSHKMIKLNDYSTVFQYVPQ